MRITCLVLILAVLMGCQMPESGNGGGIAPSPSPTNSPNDTALVKDMGDYWIIGGDMMFSKKDDQAVAFINSLSAVPQEPGARGVYPGYSTYVTPWPLGKVPYFFDPNMPISNELKALFLEAVEEIDGLIDGIEFSETTYLGDNTWGLRVICLDDSSGYPGKATVGYQQYGWNGWAPYGGRIWLRDGADMATKKNILHELCHVLGMYHEHQRPDRNSYITFYPTGDSETDRWYMPLPSSVHTFGEYDYYSITHYYGMNGTKFIIRTLDEAMQKVIGRQTCLSAGDIRTLDYIYNRPVGEAGYWTDRRHDCYLDWVDRRHDCTRLVDVQHNCFLHWVDRRHDCPVWVDRAHSCDLAWVDRRHDCTNWVNVPQTIPWGGYWDTSTWPWTWVQQYTTIYVAQLQTVNTISCGQSGWPHQELQSPYLISCGKTGWPHQEIQTISTISCGQEGWPHRELQAFNTIHCGIAGVPHQEYQTFYGVISCGQPGGWPHQELQWVNLISCGKLYWPHQEWHWNTTPYFE